MKNLILSSTLVLIASSTAQAQQAVQWKVSDGGNGHWYLMSAYGAAATWESARVLAASRGGYLVTITSAAEQSFVHQRTTTGSCEPTGVIWLGGDQPPGSPTAGSWRWVTGERWGYTNWSPGEPNDYGGFVEDCVLMYQQSGTWIDGRKDGSASPACVYTTMIEWSADCNDDGIVDYGQILDGTFPDANGNGVPDCCDGGGSCCPGDVASDGMVDGVDLAAVLSQWGTQRSGTFNADIDNSGLVDGGDLALVLGGWGPCNP